MVGRKEERAMFAAPLNTINYTAKKIQQKKYFAIVLQIKKQPMFPLFVLNMYTTVYLTFMVLNPKVVRDYVDKEGVH